MIVDTSVWIEFLRPGPSRAGDHLDAMLRRQDPVLVPETVLLELLSGSGDEALAARRQRLLESFDVVPLEPVVDSLSAARLQRQCRRGSDVVRSLGD